MSAPDVVHGMLTALFTAAALHGLRHGILSPGSGWRSRIDHLLHAVMALAMAAMPWGRVPVGTAQSTFFVAAALWFPLTAVRRRHESQLTATARRLPYAVGMAAMAWMVMPHATKDAPHQTQAKGLPSAHQGAHLACPAGESSPADVVIAVLALCLLTCALRSLTRAMLPVRATKETVDISDAVGTSTLGESYRHFWDGSMALGTAIMLLMPH
ncbi:MULTISPECIES: DUF5134 domain-containing protein [unclassified Streptomyces]|uniref:DUF5134 domain-containing protein n=1 Tax=unclassified Streptomyces TaxID=2593676 RepID=UPI00148859A9|nr:MULTISPECIES: DUF5134 domain-containing protein [unclassified Streptomyces]